MNSEKINRTPAAAPAENVELSVTGIPGMDDILRGGLPRNCAYLVKGHPGVGKTTLALQYLLEGAKLGERGLYITLSETKRELENVARSHGWSLESISLFELSAMEQQLAAENQNTVFHPSEVELHQVTQVLLAEVERVNPARVVLDSLSELRLLSEDALRYRRQMLTLKQYFASRNCTVLFLDDHSSESGDLQVQSIVHGVFSLEKLSREYGASRRRLEVVKLRGVKFREGYHDYMIKTGGAVVFPRLVASEHNAEFKREPFASGITGLDSLLGGGLDRGTSSLFMGPAGTGKSTAALKFAAAAAERGENSVVFTFDESLGTMLNRCKMLGMDLAPHLRSGLVRSEQIDPAELSPGELTAKIMLAVNKEQVRMVVIDSLNGYMNAMPGEEYLILHLHELLSYLNQQGIVTILTLAQHGLVGNMQSPVDLTYLGDTIVLFRYFETTGEVRKAVSVIKKRSGDHETFIRELSSKDGALTVGKPLAQFHGLLTGIPTILNGPLPDADESCK